jgi:hypothetical protein
MTMLVTCVVSLALGFAFAALLNMDASPKQANDDDVSDT